MSLTDLLMRLVAFVAFAQNGTPPPANFVGNLTTFVLANNHLMALAQQSDCSLTLRHASHSLNFTGPVFNHTLSSSTPHYEQVLHNSAGLTTTGGSYPSGCGNTQTGITSRKIVFAGTATSNLRVYAGHFYDLTNCLDQAFISVADANDKFQSFTNLGETNNVVDIATADLNGDGNGDLVLIDDSPTTGSLLSTSPSAKQTEHSRRPPRSLCPGTPTSTAPSSMTSTAMAKKISLLPPPTA